MIDNEEMLKMIFKLEERINKIEQNISPFKS